MGYQIDPDTGEEYWVDEERPDIYSDTFMGDASDREINDMIRMRRESELRNRPIPVERPVEVPEIHERPDDDLIHSEIPINIKGYGRKIAAETGPGTGQFTNEWGEPVSSEYVKDIDDTIAQYDRGEISDREIGERGGIPPRPQERDLSAFEQWQNFMEYARPKIEAEVSHRAEDEVSEWSRKTLANSDWSLMNEREKAAHDAKMATMTATLKDRYLQQELSDARTAFGRDFAKREATRKAEELRNKTLVDGPNGTKVWVNRVTKEVMEETGLPNTRVGKISDIDKQELSNIKEEKRSLRSQIRATEGRAAYDDTAAGQLSLYKQELADLENEEKKILGGYRKEEQQTEPQDKPKDKTVTIEGKQYKDGDIVVQNGKKFRVRVK